MATQEAPTVNPQQVDTPSYAPALANATTYTATPYKVEPQGLVQERIKGIVAEDSPLMQQAATIANQKSNERGLINSNLAIGSAQQAVIGAAAPIAQADAGAINTAMMKTADQQNAASQFGAQANTNVALANADAANKAKGIQAEGTIQLTNTKMQQDAQMALARLDSQTRERLATMDSQTRSLLQTNQSASNAYVQAVTNIANIQMNPQLKGTAKQNAIDSQINLLKEQLAVLQGTNAATQQQIRTPQNVASLDLGQYFLM